MSTQQAPSIDFQVAQNFTSFQLVELPEEIVQLIANHKGEAPVLELKSDAASGNAVLCSPNKTFPIRSVNTSNSLFVVRPVECAEQDQDAIPSGGLQAISSCGATLELSKSSESALPYLRNALPVYSSRDLDPAAAAKSSFQSICNDVPLSRSEILDAWNVLCAFEAQGASYRPTADVLLELWKAIMTAATAENLDIGNAFLVDDLWKAVRDEEFPRGMFDAFLHRVEDCNSMEIDADAKWCTVDQARCSGWIGTLLLETRTADDQTMAVSDLVDVWRDHVSESWRANVKLEFLQDNATLPKPDVVALKSDKRLSGVSASAARVPESKAPSKARKWHDKFKKGKT